MFIVMGIKEVSMMLRVATSNASEVVIVMDFDEGVDARLDVERLIQGNGTGALKY